MNSKFEPILPHLLKTFLMIRHALPNKVQPTNDKLDGISNI